MNEGLGGGDKDEGIARGGKNVGNVDTRECWGEVRMHEKVVLRDCRGCGTVGAGAGENTVCCTADAVAVDLYGGPVHLGSCGCVGRRRNGRVRDCVENVWDGSRDAILEWHSPFGSGFVLGFE